ncbi:MAG: hypothetical protein QGF46_06835 [Planctomycetota bacterium]|nr:hypothetical protein [Planctomycetota bacterium]
MKVFISGSLLILIISFVGCNTAPSVKLLDGDIQYSLNAQVWDNGHPFSYALKYVYNPDFQRIETRYIGPSCSVAFTSRPIYSEDGDWKTLEWRVERSSYVVLLAKWKIAADGELVVDYVRTEPFVEIRNLPLKPFQMSPDYQWRPYVDGEGQGIWRN